jgi:hypothetical protein
MKGTISNPMREYTYVIDEDGLIWQGGENYDAPEIYEQFYRNMTREADGRTFTICLGEKCWIVAKDTPFVVDSVRVATVPGAADPERSATGVTIVLNGGIEEPLDPATLSVGAKNVLYTAVKSGAFPARFSRKAYYELTRYVVPEGAGFALVLGGHPHPIANAHASA